MNNNEIAEKVVDKIVKQIGVFNTIGSWEKGALEAGIDEFNDQLSNQTKNAIKLEIYRLMIEENQKAKSAHEDKCNDGSTCPVSANYIKFDLYLKTNMSLLHTDTFFKSLEDNAKAVMQRIAIEPDRTGRLQNILNELDINYNDTSIIDYKKYFQETGYAAIRAETKDVMDITVLQKGMQYLAGQLKEASLDINIKEFPNNPNAPTQQSDRAITHLSGRYNILTAIISGIIGYILGRIT